MLGIVIFIVTRLYDYLFSALISVLTQLVEKTDNEIDDQIVAVIVDNKDNIKSFLLEWLNNLRHESEKLG